MAETDRTTIDVYSEGTRIAADLFTPAGNRPEGGWPSILLCHGWGGTKDHLARYAEKFAAAGFFAMTFDYRGWGDSDGRITSIRAVHMEMDAISSAEIPEGTWRAAQLTPPWQIRKNSAPKTTAARQFRHVSGSLLRVLAYANRTTPATKKRVPDTKNGGMDVTA